MRWRSWGWWWLGTVLTGLVLLVTGLVSHAAATPQLVVVSLAADWLHLAATALWIGGLFQLLLVFPVALKPLPPPLRLRALAAAVPRFSGLAVVCVAVLAVTGAYQLWLHVGSIEALFTTVYGVTLSMKLVLIPPAAGTRCLQPAGHAAGLPVAHARAWCSCAGRCGLVDAAFSPGRCGRSDIGCDGAAARRLSYRRAAGARPCTANRAGNRRSGRGGRLTGAAACGPRRRRHEHDCSDGARCRWPSRSARPMASCR